MGLSHSRWTQEKEDELLCLISDGYNFNQISKMLAIDCASVIQKFERMFNLFDKGIDWRKERPKKYLGSSKQGLTPEERKRKAYIDRLYADK